MKNRLVLTTLLISTYCLTSCHSDGGLHSSFDVAVLPETKYAWLFDDIRPESQRFQISATTDNIISGSNGTVVFIPAKSFVDSEGRAVEDSIEVELIEVLSVADFIRTNLQTVSNGLPLQSEGMLFVNATSGGRQLTLARDKELQVELPTIDNLTSAADIQIFSGSYDSRGNMNWSESGKPDDKLILLPLELFDYHICTPTWYKHNYGYPRYNPRSCNDPIDTTTFHQPHLAQTWIATREFEERFPYIVMLQRLFDASAWYNAKRLQPKEFADSAIYRIYLDNTDKDLWYCDSLAFQHIVTWHNRLDMNDTADLWPDLSFLREDFEQFYRRRLTSVISFPPDVDLSSSNARAILGSQGFSEKEIDELLGMYARQKLASIARRNRANSSAFTKNSFALANLGWVNCDRFYNDPRVGDANILASVNNSENYDFVCLTLVINGQRVALNGNPTDNGKFSFAGNPQAPARLPIGDKATIVGISYMNNRPYFGTREIVISSDAVYNIDLYESSKNDIGAQLASIR